MTDYQLLLSVLSETPKAKADVQAETGLPVDRIRQLTGTGVQRGTIKNYPETNQLSLAPRAAATLPKRAGPVLSLGQLEAELKKDLAEVRALAEGALQRDRYEELDRDLTDRLTLIEARLTKVEAGFDALAD